MQDMPEDDNAIIRLRDLTPPRRKIEMRSGNIREMLSPAELDLPTISKLDRLQSSLQKDLTNHQNNNIKTEDNPDGVDLEELRKKLDEFIKLIVPEATEEEIAGMGWYDLLMVLGVFNQLSERAQRFLPERLGTPALPSTRPTVASRAPRPRPRRSRT